MWYVGGACSNTPLDIIVRNCWFNQQVNLLKQVFWHWMSHLRIRVNGNDTMECYIIHNIVSVWASEPGGYRTEMTYHSGAHTELQKLPAVPQSCMWNPQCPFPTIFLPAGYAKVHGQLIFMLSTSVCWSVGSVLSLITCNNHVTLLLRDSTLVHFGSCLV